MVKKTKKQKKKLKASFYNNNTTFYDQSQKQWSISVFFLNRSHQLLENSFKLLSFLI